MDMLSGGSDVYGRLQKINKIAAEEIKKEIETRYPNFEKDVNRVWEIIEEFLYEEDKEILEIKELREKLTSICSVIKNLKISTPKTKVNLEEQKKADYSTLFHYADLYGLEPYFLVEEPGGKKDKNSDENFVDSIISNVKYTKNCLKRVPVSSDDEELSYQIEKLKGLISKTDSEETSSELKSELSELCEKQFALKKENPFFTRNLDKILLKLESCDLKDIETPLSLLEDSKSTPNFEPSEEGDFERCELELCDPSSDKKFNDEIFAYASNGKLIEDAPILDWAQCSNPFFVPSKPLPRHSCTNKRDKNEEYNKWEYSSVYAEDEDNNRRLCERFNNHFSNVFRNGEIEKVFKPQDGVFDEDTCERFRLQFDRGEINVDIDKMLQISPVFNPFYFIPVRDEKSGEILDYKVGLKNLELREREALLRGELKFWIEEDEFPRPTIYGWKSPKIQEEDEDEDEEDAISSKPKEKKVNRSDPQLLREKVFKLLENISDEALIVDEEVTPSMKKANDVLKSLVETAHVPFNCLDDLLDSLALDFNSRQNLEIERPHEKIPSQKWNEDAINENFESIKNFDTNEPLPLVSSKSIFQELFSQLEETEESKEIEVDAVKLNTLKKDEFVQGSKVCVEENVKLLTNYESLHGEGGRGEIFTQHPNEKHETIDLENTLESYELKYLTYPYYSTDVFQPDALLIRRLLQKIDGFKNLTTAKFGISLEQQKEMLKSVKKGSDSAIFEFENVKDPSGIYLNCKTIQKSIVEGQKLVDDFFNFSSDEVLEEDFEIDFDFDFQMAPNVESVKLKVDAIEFDFKKLLDDFDFDAECEEFEEDDDYAFKCLENHYETAKTLEFDDLSENSDDERVENTFTWAPLKSGESFDAEELLSKSLSLIDMPNVHHAKSRCEKFKTWIRKNSEIECEKLNRFIRDSAKVDPHCFDGFDRMHNSPEYEENEEEEEIASKKPNIEKVDSFKEMGRAEENSVVPTLKLMESKNKMYVDEFVEEIDTNIPVDISSIEMAYRYNFDLDTFQKAAILALEGDNHVFVSAHTSAGKTVVAEYAIAMARRNSTRVIYTSPIKALSNQKFYDFRKKFDHGENGISVGLITGDVQINEKARCLIMTTEILRSMIYNCPDKISDLEFVIFDEVHYLNDPDRGHVWEESIILLPDRVKIVMLSATVPNAEQFSSWIGQTKKRKVIISSTHFRPVPLHHYLLQFEGKGPIEEISTLIKKGDEPLSERKFKEHEEKKLKSRTNKESNPEKPHNNKLKTNYKNKEKKRPEYSWTNLIKSLETSQKLPVVIFVFSRKKCDELALNCTVDLTDSDEKARIEHFFNTHVSSKLDGEDRQLPQVQVMKQLLLKGIGVHHSGILPMLKEIVECLFGESIVKVLFATETFAMGVNMPARTVIFNRIQKFDKVGLRNLEPGEYIQMAGRAGRRGKDDVGYVYILDRSIRDKLEYSDLYTVMEGSPKPLSSQFKVFYRTILNVLLKREHMSIKMLLDRSFLNNAKDSNKEDDYQKSLKLCKSLEESLDEFVSSDEIGAYSEFYKAIKNYLSEESFDLNTTIESGRLVRFTCKEYVNKIGVVLCKYLVQQEQKISILFFEDKSYDKLRPKTSDSIFKEPEIDFWFKIISFFPFLEKDSIMTVTSFKDLILDIKDVYEVYDSKLKKSDVLQINDYLKKVKTIHPGTKRPEFVTDFTSTLHDAIKRIKLSRMTDKLYLSSKTISEINSVESLENFERFFTLQIERERLNELRKEISQDCEDRTFLSKREVLYARKFIGDNGEVLLKGQVASRISKFEIIVSEILFANILADLNPYEIASLFSCFVYEKKEEEILLQIEELPKRLREAIEAVENICKSIQKDEVGYEVPQDEGYDSQKISFKIAPIVYNWAKGKSFKKILQMEAAEEFQEGIIIRFIIQLLEVLKEIEAAVKIMADGTIREKIQAAAKAMKRGIVFAPSLYLQVENGSEVQTKNKSENDM